MKKGPAIALIALFAVVAIVFGALFVMEKQNVADKTAGIEALTADLSAKTAEIETLTADAAAKDAEIETLTADAAAKDAEIETLTADAAAKDAEIETLTADAAAKTAEIETLTADAAAKTAEIETLTADAAAKTAEIETLTADAAAKTAEIETLTADAAAKTAEIETLTANAAAKDAEIETLTADAAAKTAEIETLTADVAAKTAEIETLTADVAAKTAEIESLKAQAPEEEDLSGVTEGVYTSTKRLIKKLGEKDFKSYTLHEIDSDKEERVKLGVNSTSDGDQSFSYDANLFFNEYNDRMKMYVWDFVVFNEADRATVISMCNSLNSQWQWAKFYVEDGDKAVSVSFTLPMVDDSSMGDLMWEALLHIDTVLGYAYDDLLPYAAK
ncbi:MAG: YbjN domain-containing protein [Clostridia bacterium]|nr:YbjN domain-containing protein [Clostridia bacterium]